MNDRHGNPEVRDLVFEYLERSEREGPQVLEEICSRAPDLASSVRKRVELLVSKGLTASPSGAGFPERIGGFELLERLGGGGMGVVYRARDAVLEREVALKLVRPGDLLFSDTRRRFQHESEAIARLAHPGVVPVYSAGEEDGVPYLAMELVEGCTLAEAIERLARAGVPLQRLTGADLMDVLPDEEGASSEWPQLFQGSWSEVCARIVREVAEALEHAHRRGVLHRDVKPSNVMITRSGRVMLLDFGLAAAEGQERLTRTGSAMGSLPYLSPEQLEGDWKSVDARSDVYSLGVTLYELLSLKLPYEGETSSKLRAAILEGGAPSLRRRNPTVSWALDTIALTAMHPDRGRRYASAAALASDLTSALEGRPIAARRSGVLRRVQRWTTRHPARAAVVALTALITIGGPLLLGWQERQSRLAIEAKAGVIEAKSREIETKNEELARALADLDGALAEARTQRDEAQLQKGLAERNFERALAAVDTMLTRISEDELRDVPRLHELRRRVLQDALAFYLELLEERGPDPELRLETARAWRRVGDLHGWLDDARASEAAFVQAIEFYAGLLDERGDSAMLLAELVDVRRQRFFPLRQMGQLATAERNLDLARGEIARALERAPGEHAHEVRRASLVLQKAGLHTERGEWREAVDLLDAVVPGLEAARERAPEDLDLTSTLAQAHHQLGVLWAQAASPADEERRTQAQLASEHHARVVELVEPMLEHAPGHARLRHQLARSLVNLGTTTAGEGRLAEAEPLLRRGAELTETLLQDFPGVDTYASDRAVVHTSLGAVLLQLGQPDEGLALMRSAISDFEALSARQPKDLMRLQQLASANLQLGVSTWMNGRDPGASLPPLDRAREAHERALELSPGAPQMRMGLVWCHDYRSQILLADGAIEKAAVATLEWARAMPDPRLRTTAALRLAHCTAELLADDDVPAELRAELAAGYDESAAGLLEEALEAGLAPASIRDAAEYGPLLARPAAAAVLDREP